MPVRLYGATSGYVDIKVPDVADNGTVTLSPNLMSPGLVLIRKQSFSGATSVSLDGVFTSTYKNYRIMVKQTNTYASSGGQLLMRLRAAGVDSTVNYRSEMTNFGTDSTSTTPARVNQTGAFVLSYTGGSDPYPVITLDVFSPQIATHTSVVGDGLSINPLIGNYRTSSGGDHTLSTSYDGFTIYPSAGAITGDIYVYGYAETVGDYPQLNQVPGMSLVTTQSFSAVSSVSVNNCFTSTYDNYRLMLTLTGVSAADVGISYRNRLAGTDATTNYQRQTMSRTGTTQGGSSAADSKILDAATSQGTLSVATYDVFGPALATATRLQGIQNIVDSTPAYYTATAAIWHTTATAYDGFSLIPATGTISGSLAIYGYRKA